jgi:hypothetical protein
MPIRTSAVERSYPHGDLYLIRSHGCLCLSLSLFLCFWSLSHTHTHSLSLFLYLSISLSLIHTGTRTTLYQHVKNAERSVNAEQGLRRRSVMTCTRDDYGRHADLKHKRPLHYSQPIPRTCHLSKRHYRRLHHRAHRDTLRHIARTPSPVLRQTTTTVLLLSRISSECVFESRR